MELPRLLSRLLRYRGVTALVAAAALLCALPQLTAETNPEPRTDNPSAPPEAPQTPAAEPLTGDTANPMPKEEEDLPLPRLADMPIPTVEELFKNPVDWIVVELDKEEKVLVVKPVSPRPDTVAKMEAAIEESKKWPKPANDEERQKQREQREELNWITLQLAGEMAEDPIPSANSEDAAVPEGELLVNEYQMQFKLIKRIIYHEDLILKRAEIFMDEGKLRDAFELIYTLERRLPNWPTLVATRNRLLFFEADAALKNNDAESALVYLEELHGRNAKYSGLYTKLGEVSDALIAASHGAGDYRKTRHFLRRLARCEPEHEIARKWRESLLAETRALVEKARQESAAGAHDLAAYAVDKAARIWPTAPGLAEEHRRFANRFQQIKVGTVRFAGEKSSYPLPTLADEREQALTRFCLFEVDSIDDASHYRTPFFEQWTPIDLGRKVVFTLRQTRAVWESKPVLTAGTVASDLSDRIDPGSPRYDERLAHFVQSLTVRSPFEFEVRFSRVPVRTEPLFRFPVESSSRSLDSQPVLSRRFERQDRDDGTVAYRRSMPQPDRLGDYNIAEIVEQRYDSHERALQGLLRGDVSILTELRPWQVSDLAKDERFFVLPYAVPTVHVLQFNPRSKPGRIRELRTAVAVAVDRARLLKGLVLRNPNVNVDDYLTTAPYSRKNHAFNALVASRSPNMTLAVALQLAAKKQLGGTVPALKMVCVPDAVAQSVAKQMIADWKRVGLNVELAPDSADPSENWDIIYRTVRMEEPLVELWQFLTVDQPPSIEAIRHLPDWLRDELIRLENAGDWNTAVTLLHALQQHLYAEAEYIPLWELKDYLVVRKNIRGMPGSPMHPYHNVERWVSQSWYPSDTPEPSRPSTAQTSGRAPAVTIP